MKPRLTARELVTAHIPRTAEEAARWLRSWIASICNDAEGMRLLWLLTAAIERDREAGQAEVRVLRKALELVAWLDAEHKDCGECGWAVELCDKRKGISHRFKEDGQVCYGYVARRALAEPKETK